MSLEKDLRLAPIAPHLSAMSSPVPITPRGTPPLCHLHHRDEEVEEENNAHNGVQDVEQDETEKVDALPRREGVEIG